MNWHSELVVPLRASPLSFASLPQPIAAPNRRRQAIGFSISLLIAGIFTGLPVLENPCASLTGGGVSGHRLICQCVFSRSLRATAPDKRPRHPLDRVPKAQLQLDLYDCAIRV